MPVIFETSGRLPPGPPVPPVSNPLQITTSSLPGVLVGASYSQALQAAGGTGPYTWNLVSVSPWSDLWLYLQGSTLSGIPQEVETEIVTVQVTDALGATAQATFNIAVTSPLVAGSNTIKWNPGNFLMSDIRDYHGGFSPTQRQSEIDIFGQTGTGGTFTNSKWKGYVAFYSWDRLETSFNNYDFSPMINDFLYLQAHAPGAHYGLGIWYSRSQGNLSVTVTPPAPSYLFASSATYGAGPPGGSGSGYGMSGWNGSNSSPAWQISSAAVWRPAVMNRYIAVWQALANTVIPDGLGFTFDTHPLVELLFDPNENSWNFWNGPAAPGDWSAAAQNAQIEAEMAAVVAAFPHTSFATYQSFGNAQNQFPDPNLPGVIGFAASNRNGLANADVFGDGIADVSAQEIYCGFVWNGSAWVAGGTDYRGEMPYLATIQAPDYVSNAPHAGQYPQVFADIFATCTVLRATHICWNITDEVISDSTFALTLLTPFINSNPVPNTTYPTGYPQGATPPTIVTPTAGYYSPNTTNNGIFSLRMLAQGGTPPYWWSFTGPAFTKIGATGNQYALPPSGWLQTATGVLGTDTLSCLCTDNNGQTVSKTVTVNIDGTLRFFPLDPVSGNLNLPPANQGTKYHYQLQASGGTNAGFTYSLNSGSLGGLNLSSTGLISGTPTSSGNINAGIKVTDSGAHTSLCSILINVQSKNTAPRPSGNTGTGFFVDSGGYFRDPNGFLFQFRGLNRAHYDSASWASNQNGSLSRANAARTFYFFINSQTTGQQMTLALNENINNGILPILTMSQFPDGSPTTGSTSTTELTNAVNFWVAGVSAFTPFMNKIVINIANEWGASNSTVWRDSYITAVTSLRAAGYTCPLMIDSGGSGQDPFDIINYAPAIQNADPQHNCIFAFHSYGNNLAYQANIQSVTKGTTTTVTLASSLPYHPFLPPYPSQTANTFDGISGFIVSGVQGMTQLNGTWLAPTNVGGVAGAWTVNLTVNSNAFDGYTGGGTLVPYGTQYYYKTLFSNFAALRASGVCVTIAEFGPGNQTGDATLLNSSSNPGPSFTNTTISQIISAAEAYQLPWCYWGWDDHSPAGLFTGWFADVLGNNGVYTNAQSFTAAGLDSVANPRYGLWTLSQPSEFFL